MLEFGSTHDAFVKEALLREKSNLKCSEDTQSFLIKCEIALKLSSSTDAVEENKWRKYCVVPDLDGSLNIPKIKFPTKEI